MRRLFFLFFSLITTTTQAQIDKEFWFAAPYIAPANGNQPVYFYFSALNQAATVTISMPANPGFKPLTYAIAANKSIRVDMTPYLSTIQNSPAGSVLNKGIYISSTTYITAYYELLGIVSGFGLGNTEIFCLKGGRGLGTKFYTPFQTVWANNASINATSAIDIVATEDSTHVTITITNPANGYPAGATFTISLNKGQSYSVQAELTTGAGHLTGSLVTSDKPIAVSVKDDSVLDDTNYDLIGDQLVPVNAVGTEYIAVAGPSLYYIRDPANVTALCGTEDSTLVNLNGKYITTINAGQTYIYRTFPTENLYFQSTKPMYAFHVIGLDGDGGGNATNGTELAGCLLPNLECTGSKQIDFWRSTPVDNYTDNPFDTVYLSVVVKTGYEKYFKLINTNTGQSVLFPYPASTTFSPVSNSNYSAVFAIYPTSIMGVGPFTLINDSIDFHLGMMYGEETHSFTYGYFADYGGISLGASMQTLCKDSILTLDAGPDKGSYLWEPGGATTETITVSTPGLYTVTVTKGSCTYKDSTQIGFYPPIDSLFKPDSISFCANIKTAVGPDSSYSSYLWKNGSTQPTIYPTTTGYYDLTIKDKYGCKEVDSIYVTIKPLPTVKISDNQPDTAAFCTDSTVNLTAIAVNAVPKITSYAWQNGDSTPIYSSPHHSYPDIYWVKTTGDNGCATSDTLFADCTPYIWAPNVFTPNDDPQHLNEVFFVKGLKPNKWSLEIYNRWGSRVYYNADYDNSWNGNTLDDGVYYYYLHHVQNKANLKGWVEIIR